jgi:hypothetical protein
MARLDGAWGAPPCLRGGGLYTPPYLRATPDLDPEELRHEGGDRDRLGCEAGRPAGGGGAERRRADPAGVRHRAARRMTILDVVVPPFDSNDERFD